MMVLLVVMVMVVVDGSGARVPTTSRPAACQTPFGTWSDRVSRRWRISAYRLSERR
jgi:hypothetical protein